MNTSSERFDDDDPPALKRGGRSRLVVVIAAVIVAGFVFVGWTDTYTDWLWYQSVGFQTVFSTMLWTKAVTALVAGLVVAAVVYANLRLALRLAPGTPFGGRVLKIEGRTVELPDTGKLVAALALPVAAIVGIVGGMGGWNAWEVVQRYLHQVPFGETDPVFGRDIAFYVFTLPMLEWIGGALVALVVVSLVGAVLIYVARGGVYAVSGRSLPALERRPRAHLLGLVSALFLVVAWQTWLAIPNLLYSSEGPVAGACYTDLNARLPLLWTQIGVAVLAAALAAASGLTSRANLVWAGVLLYGVSLLASWTYPSSVQRFSVAPNELAKETPYIERNIAATRKAFALDAVDQRELSGDATLTAADIEANRATVENIRLWDQEQLLATFAQIQEIRTYYEFPSVDNDRYRIGGRTRQVMLSARELAAESLPTRNWINERLTFTHGFGLTLGPVTEVTPEGLPLLYVKDIPPAAPDPVLEVKQPQIYFGELSNDHVYVRTRTEEFDYPSGNDNVYASYEGADGVSIGSTWRQILFAMRLGDLKLLLSDAMTPESRVLLNRNIGQRLSLVAPFLRYDSDPYLVIHEGRLVWIADAYTVTDRYPYSQPTTGRINYVRNSVKATVDAYDGTVRLYVADDKDPIIRTYASIFPGILHPLDEMPAGLREHLRYPEDIFRTQAMVYATYHMANPQIFYNKEDQWAVASTPSAAEGGEEQAMAPYYTIMRLPGEQSEEFILMLPFTPQRKDNLASWMVARADGANYGKLVAYQFPKQKLVYGPKQIAARINQTPEISSQLSLWSRSGSQVTFGQLMVIPIEESLAYVQPLYLRAATGKIPELQRVIVAIDNQIAMEETLDESLAKIFGSAPPKPKPPTPDGGEPAPPQPDGGSGDLATQARQTYDRAVEAQRAGDWAKYGEEIKRLGEILQQMSPQK